MGYRHGSHQYGSLKIAVAGKQALTGQLILATVCDVKHYFRLLGVRGRCEARTFPVFQREKVHLKGRSPSRDSRIRASAAALGFNFSENTVVLDLPVKCRMKMMSP
jgi:hypothetical protein